MPSFSCPQLERLKGGFAIMKSAFKVLCLKVGLLLLYTSLQVLVSISFFNLPNYQFFLKIKGN